MAEEPITKDEVREEHQPVFLPNFPPFFVMAILTVAYLVTHPRQLARAALSLMFGAVAFGIVAGFVIHMGVDAFNYAWDLWEKV